MESRVYYLGFRIYDLQGLRKRLPRDAPETGVWRVFLFGATEPGSVSEQGCAVDEIFCDSKLQNTLLRMTLQFICRVCSIP